MKKLIVLGAFMMSIFGVAFANYGAQCGDDCCPQEQPTGECYCKYVYYQPCPYVERHCVEEQYTVPRKCCRMVPQYYEVKKCRYVPEYYSVTCCRQVPEYYEVPECRTRQRVICEPKCNYIPRYYWKCENRCATGCP